jgi:hypothetical protein
MADSKITALTALTAADPANDMFPVVDVSDTSMAASGTTKRISINNILACSPSATLASATITGDLTVDTSTLKVDSANNRVGIGTATPGAYALDVKSATGSAQQRIFGSNQNSITFGNAAGGASNGFLMGRSFSSDDANNFFVFDLASSALRFFIGNTGNVGIGTAAPTEAVDLNSGNLKLTNGNVVIGTSGKGIDFSATASGSGTMTSELLADYEEGTWTGTLKGSVSDPTIAVTATGAYTKVGRLVTATIGYSNVLTTGASGNVTIAGLPFAGAASSAGSVITFDMFTTSTTLACWNTGTTIAFYVSGGFIPATHNAGASRSVTVTITYHV